MTIASFLNQLTVVEKVVVRPHAAISDHASAGEQRLLFQPENEWNEGRDFDTEFAALFDLSGSPQSLQGLIKQFRLLGVDCPTLFTPAAGMAAGKPQQPSSKFGLKMPRSLDHCSKCSLRSWFVF